MEKLLIVKVYMDNTAPNPQNTAPAPSKSTKGFLVVIAYVVFLVIGVAAGVGVDRFVLKNTTSVAPSTSGQAQSVESGLPVATELLINPVVSQWRGGVEGVLVEKDASSITISENNRTLKIQLQGPPGGTFFYQESAEAGTGFQQVSLDDIAIGTRLRGDFFVKPGVGSNEVIGSSFTIVR